MKDCDSYKGKFTDYLMNSFDPEERKKLEEHLASCLDCRKEFEEVAGIWNLMGEIPVPEPSPGMREGFETMMAAYRKQLVSRKSFSKWLHDLFVFKNEKILLKPAFGFLLLLTGLAAGYLMNQPGKMAAQNRQIDSLSSQISEMKEIMMLSLLQDQSASRRIQAVSYTEDMTSLDKKISDALFTTLNEDTNVNVRLATLEALAKMADSPVVREGLIRSIALQNSPIMQSAIADVMVRLHEKKSVGQLRQLLERQDLNQMVKVNIEKSIQQLI